MARVLLVDDDLAELAALKRALAAAGHGAIVATNAADALAALAQRPVVTLVAPECDGGEGAALAERLRATGVPGVVELGRELARPAEARAVAEAVARASAAARSTASPTAAATATPTAAATSTATSSPTATPTSTATRAASSAGAAARPTSGSSARGGAPSAVGVALLDTSTSALSEAAALEEAQRELASSPAPEPRPTAAPAAALSPGPRRRPLDRAWVEEMLRQAEKADYFDLLGVPPDCRRSDVEEAAGRLLEELAPERCPKEDAVLLDKVDEVRRILVEAREVLADDAVREQYRRALGR